jgi:hypothetical protein
MFGYPHLNTQCYIINPPVHLVIRTKQGSYSDFTVRPNPDISPPSFIAHKSLWTEIPYYAVFRVTATLHLPPQFVVKVS